MSLVDYNDFPNGNDTAAESFVKMVRLNVRDIRNSFFEIGFRLQEAHNNAYYKDLGFANIHECAEALFDIKKSTCYNLMDIASRFASKEKAMQIDERYKYYSQSQLVELAAVKINIYNFIKICSPEDPVAKIREARVIWSNANTKNDEIFFNERKELRNCKNLSEVLEVHSQFSRRLENEKENSNSNAYVEPEVYRSLSREQLIKYIERLNEDRDRLYEILHENNIEFLTMEAGGLQLYKENKEKST